MPDNCEILVQYRLTSAKEKLKSAKLLLENGNLKDSVSRSYYAMFTSTRALLARDRIDFSKHSGVISYFQKQYIKTGMIDTKYSKYISQAFQIRNNADYADFFLVSKTDAEEQYKKAKEFCEMIEQYLMKNGRL